MGLNGLATKKAFAKISQYLIEFDSDGTYRKRSKPGCSAFNTFQVTFSKKRLLELNTSAFAVVSVNP